MNKYEIVFNMFKDKMLFVFKRCEHNDNKISTSKNLSFLSTISSVITRSFKFIVKNESNENNSDMNLSKNISNKKRITLIFKTFKEKMIKKPDLIDIAKIDVSIYYHLIRNKKNKFFSLTMNKIYDTSYEFSSLRILQKDNRIPLNKSCLCDSEIKYKRCYESYILKIIQINNAEIFIFQKML